MTFLATLFVIVAFASASTSSEVYTNATISLTKGSKVVLNNTETCFQPLNIDIDDSIPPPQWLDNWHDLESMVPCDFPIDWAFPIGTDDSLKSQIIAYNFASGTFVADWVQQLKKRDDIYDVLQNFWDTGSVGSSDEVLNSGQLKKRWSWSSSLKWTKSSSNKARVLVLNTISATVGACGSSVLELTRSAICATTNGNYGCFSWSGGGHTMKCSIAHDLIQNGISNLGEYSFVSEHASHAFESSAWHSACLSNRANGCS